MLELTRDPLSELHFPGGRSRSFLAYAADTGGQVANVIISLMENGDVEVRIYRPAMAPDETLFGVFRASLKEDCRPPTSRNPVEPVTDQDAGQDSAR